MYHHYTSYTQTHRHKTRGDLNVALSQKVCLPIFSVYGRHLFSVVRNTGSLVIFTFKDVVNIFILRNQKNK